MRNAKGHFSSNRAFQRLDLATGMSREFESRANCHIFPAFLYRLLLYQLFLDHLKTHNSSNHPPYPTEIFFLGINLLPQNTHDPYPTSTTQKRHPIFLKSHEAHGHRILNQNPPHPMPTIPINPQTSSTIPINLQTPSSSEQRSRSFFRPPT